MGGMGVSMGERALERVGGFGNGAKGGWFAQWWPIE